MNTQFRSWVTSASFHLTLGTTHIEALVWIDEVYRRRRGNWPSGTRSPRQFLTGVHGLIKRGLAEHVYPREPAYRLTRAGELAREMLREAGLWDEIHEGMFGTRARRGAA